jgi:ankyrin repeat protein
MQLLIERGADVNAAALYGFTPLQFARLEEKEDRSRVIQLLIEHGAT